MERKIDIAVIGAMKSASTTVTDYLRQHPGVFVPDVKTLNYFSYGVIDETLLEKSGQQSTASFNAVRTLSEYASFYQDAPSDQLLCDCSDSYYFYPGTSDRLYEHNPNMKIVLVMREPVSRAYSSFNHARSHLLEAESDFEAAFLKSRGVSRNILPICQYEHLGRYGELLIPFVDRFGLENIFLLGFEELINDYDAAMSRLTQFLGVPTFKGKRLWSNPTFVPRPGFTSYMLKKISPPMRWLLRASSGRKGLKGIIKIFVRKAFQRPASLEPTVRQRISPIYSEDLKVLEENFGKGFYSYWR